MARHVHQRSPDQPTSAGRLLRRLVAIIIAITTLLLAVPAATPAAAQDAPGTGAIEVHVSECPPGYAGADAYTDCHANGLTGVSVEIAGATTDTKVTEGGAGAVRFADIPVGTYTISLDLPDNGQSYRTYCSLEDEDTQVPMTPANSVPGAVDLAEGQVIICDLYVIPAAAATEPLPAETPETPEVLASVTVNAVSCPDATDPEAGFDALAAACTEPAGNVTFTWGNADGPIEEINATDDDPSNGENGQVIFDEIQPGTYLLVSDVPLEAATEVLYCVADGGDRYQKEFDEGGVTSFDGIQAEQIVCDWFIVPSDLQGDPTDDPVVTPTPGGTEPAQPTPDSEDQRGVESGASLVVHLALCPVEYEGDDLYGDCHGEGIADQEFVLTGPGGEVRAVTAVPQTPGPGIVEFTELAAGDYTLMGGPPGDFGAVELYCTTQPDGARIDTAVDSTVASFAIGEGEDILCDWYYIPENARGDAPTPTPEPARAEIIVTLYACEPGETMAGASYGDFGDACTETVDGVPFTLGDPGAPPLTANTGVSGPGAVRFYDLLPADYTLAPSLPDDLANAAVFCRIDDGDAYQKTITSGSTTFVDVSGESITCDWFTTRPAPPAPEQPEGPTGSITVREFLCEKDAKDVSDWERECKAGTSGVSFSLASTDGAVALSSATNASGVATFTGLPDGFYTLKQAEGLWCKAKAERVDSQSRVIVEDGQNTDVFIYQCGNVTDLPSTGTGSGIQPMDEARWWRSLTALQVALMGVGAAGGMLLIGWMMTRRLRA